MVILSSSNRANATVRFNVGGTIYEVSRSLLEQHPDTMLARLASDTWSHGSNNPCKAGDSNDDDDDDKSGDDVGGEKKEDPIGNSDGAALFIERNGERFQYCLDYMRDGGNVVLPPSIPKEALLLDLVYYGFQGIDPSMISVKGSILTFKTSFDLIQTFLQTLDKEDKTLQRKRDCLATVQHCLRSILKDGQLQIEIPKTTPSLFYSTDYQREFNQYLEHIGLELKKGGGLIISQGNCSVVLEYLE